jgi:hypothetical protein
MPLRAEPDLKSAARALDEMILSAIHDTKRYQVLGPADLDAVLGVEKMKDALGCDDVSCASELGGALGAPFVVEGQLGRLGQEAVLSLRLMDTTKVTVMSRAAARGEPSGESLAKMMAASLSTLLGMEIELPAETRAPERTQPAAVVPNVQGYGEFTAIMTGLGKRMSNYQYTAMLSDLDQYAKKKIEAPQGVDIEEMFTFYRTTACAMLKKRDCLDSAARAYLSRWPEGSYANAVQSYVDQAMREDAEREAKKDELAKSLAQIEARSGRSISVAQADEQRAYAYYGAHEWEKAAQLFQRALDQLASDEERAISIVQMIGYSLSNAGKFGEARKALEAAQQKYPTAFRAKGLAQQLRLIPK